MKRLKLFIAALALLGGVNLANAQTDVTSTYLTNAGFESCTLTTTNASASGSAAPLDIEGGWNQSSSAAWSSSAVVAYGGSGQVNGVYAPSTDNAGNSGNTLGVSVGWSGTVTYQSAAVTLPAGRYTLTVHAYNNLSGVTQFKSLNGFVPTSGSSYLSSKTSFTYATWENDVISFDLAQATEGKFQIGGQAVSGGSGSNAKVFFDNITLEYTAWTEYSSTNTLDMTSWIVNPSFELNTYNGTKDSNSSIEQNANGHKYATGWTYLIKQTGWSNVANITENPADGSQAYETWAGTPEEFKVYQTISNLPEGVYEISASARTNDSSANDICTYAIVGSTTTYSDPFDVSNIQDPWNGISNWQTLTARFSIIGGGSAEVGIHSTKFMQFDNFHLTYLGSDLLITELKSIFSTKQTTANGLLENSDYDNVVGTERTALTAKMSVTPEETVAGWTTAVNELQDAIDTFVAAKTNYDALAREITKAAALGFDASEYAATSSSTAASALTATQGIKVAEYNLVNNTYQYGVELGTWTTTGPTGSLSDQHYKGSGNSYLEQSSSAWGSSSWTIKYDQNLTLPAGNYVFKVAGRQADSDGVTLSLTVKQGETVLGTVNDFPRGDTGLGINTSGATDFTTGEGHEYVNGGAGRGWEWRYVKFTLSEDATVNVAVDAVATTSHMWVSFCDATVQTDNEANISLIAYNVALESAQTTIANTDYENITGSEKTTLQNAIDADATLDKTDNDAIVAATTALDEAREAFVAAKSAYDAFVAAKTKTYENNLPYASSTKFAAIATAQGAADATSADDATTKTNAIISAYRKYIESNAMAEGVTGAEDKTSLIGNPNFAGVTISGTTAGAWAFDQTGGSANINSNEPFTDGDGNSNYSYFDYYNGSNNNQNLHQDIENLEPGRYILTVTARGHSNFNGNLQLYVVGKGSINIPAIGNSGGDFDRGWNDVTLEFTQIETSNITIGVKTNNSKDQWWGATRFRFVKLPTPEVTISESDDAAPTAQPLANVTLTRTLSSEYWNTFSVPFDMAIPTGWTVKEFDSAEDNVINFKDAESIVAGKPYLVKPTSDVVNPTYNNVVVKNTEGSIDGTGDYQFAAQIYNKTLDTGGTIAYLSTNGTIKKLTSGGIKGLRAYFIIPAGSIPDNVRIAFTDGDLTGVKDSFRETTYDNRVYDLLGRQVKAVKKGIYVVNGKKVIK